jgi:hypothetical protein
MFVPVRTAIYVPAWAVNGIPAESPRAAMICASLVTSAARARTIPAPTSQERARHNLLPGCKPTELPGSSEGRWLQRRMWRCRIAPR